MDGAYRAGTRALSLKRDLPDTWAAYAAWAASDTPDQVSLTVALDRGRFPAPAPAELTITRIQVLLAATAHPAGTLPSLSLEAPGDPVAQSAAVLPNPLLADLPQAVWAYDPPRPPLGTWRLVIPRGLASLAPEDIALIVDYVGA